MFLSDLQRNVVNLRNNYQNIILNIVMEFETEIVDLNREQLLQGKTNQNKNITPKYQSDIYAKAKVSMGSKAPFRTPNLYLFGDWQSGLHFVRKNDYIQIESSDEKDVSLRNKYANILGLTSENWKYIIQEMTPKIVNRIENELTAS